MKNIICNLLMAATLALAGTSAQADEWGILVGTSHYAPSTNLDTSSETGFQTGAFYSKTVGMNTAVEANLMIGHKQYNYGSSATTNSFNIIQVPVFVRMELLPLFNLGLGIYYGFGLNYPKTFTSSDLGLAGSFQIKLPLNEMFNLIGDLRYLYGISNIGTSAAPFKNRELDVLVGVGFPF